jgi:stringent starvation protein B
MQYKLSLVPYLINAFYTWSIDLDFTPLILLKVYNKNHLPEYLKNLEIILNIHPNFVRNMVFGKDTLSFEAMFKGEEFPVVIYYDSIVKIFNLEDLYGLDLADNVEKIKPKFTIIKNEKK